VKSFRITAFVLVCVLAAVLVFAAWAMPTHRRAEQTCWWMATLKRRRLGPARWHRRSPGGPRLRAWYLDVPPTMSKSRQLQRTQRWLSLLWMRPEFRDNTSFETVSTVASARKSTFPTAHARGRPLSAGRRHPARRDAALCIAIQAWQCFESDKWARMASARTPAEMHLRVGIDPPAAPTRSAPTLSGRLNRRPLTGGSSSRFKRGPQRHGNRVHALRPSGPGA